MEIVVQWTPTEYRNKQTKLCLAFVFEVSVGTLIYLHFIGIHHKEQTTNTGQYDGFAKRIIHAISGPVEQRTRVERRK